MSSNVAIRLDPTTVKRRSLCGSSHDRCMCATSPEWKRNQREYDILDARLHVALADGSTWKGSSPASRRITDTSWAPSDQSAFSSWRCLPRFNRFE